MHIIKTKNISHFDIYIAPICLIILFYIHLTQGQAEIQIQQILPAIFNPENQYHNIIYHLRLPRAILAVIIGAALGISGALLQTITRNPLAAPATLGINAGAYLAITATSIFLPQLLNCSPVFVAFIGGLLAALLVYIMSASGGLSPLRLTLSGVATSLTLASITATLQLFYENETKDLFFWGAGSLVQTNWDNTLYAAPLVIFTIIITVIFAKPLDILLLGDDIGKALGGKIQLIRFYFLIIAIFLAAVAVSVVGAIGFIGLVAPQIVKLLGYRKHWFILPLAGLWGAIFLVAADTTTMLITNNMSELPAGSITALIGSPFLVWLARNHDNFKSNLKNDSGNSHFTVNKIKLPYTTFVILGILILAISLICGLLFGNINFHLSDLINLFFGNSNLLTEKILLQLRLPRLLVAVFAGASLAVSGLLLQGVVRNPLASPEIIGITNGAGFSALAVMVLMPNIPIEFIPIAAFCGAFVTFILVYLAAWKNGIIPAQLALVGIAFSAFFGAGTNVIIVMAKLRVTQALIWLSGSTYARQWEEVGKLAIFPILLLPIAWLIAKKVDILALGEDLPKLLGMQIQKARILIIFIAVSLTAASVATVGTISFVGLVAPHITRLIIGYRHRQLLLITAILGGILVTIADTLGRVILAPKEIPAGLVTALIGTPYFLWLLYNDSQKCKLG
ncbi:MAG: Fe(3+)-hydroxamate ABC transporter permease FhuB [Nostocales cyanobacterium]|nr:MAG: Fe(3+)-hydroxamate ABC transporter permease FhuB [Nostocales cyanobacterium]TAF13388.1 MAG: Fe(3+)-hydroxamate ABC transporter permease FhuB [Nostocales cyanobacterium]